MYGFSENHSQEGDGVRYEKRWKIFWIVCGICFLVGIICCGAAWGIGTTLDDIMHGFPEEMKCGSKITKYIVTDKWDNDDDDWDNDDWDNDDWMMMTGMMSRMTGMMTKDVII